MAGGAVQAVVLGSAQDGGVPQAGCDCARCARARNQPVARRLPASLGLVDHDAGVHWLVDASPALPEQWDRLRAWAPGTRLGGVLLTHAHIGHYTGLVHFGREAAAVEGVEVLATRRMLGFLRSNLPWADVLEGHMVERMLQRGNSVALSSALAITPLEVPHRDEHSDTVAYVIEGSSRRLFYCPDIDDWALWDRDLADYLRAERIDVALLDGTFLSASELPNRDVADVPHPLATETARRTRGLECDVRLIHLNHTNALLDSVSERSSLGVVVAAEGDAWDLGA